MFGRMNNLQNARSFSFVTWLTLQIIGNDDQLNQNIEKGVLIGIS